MTRANDMANVLPTFNGAIGSSATLSQPNSPINGGTLTSSTTPRFAIGDGWLSGGDAGLYGTDYHGYQEVTSGSGIVIGTVNYASGAADSYLCGMVEVMYTAVGDANRSGYYKFRIGYTGNTSTTALADASAQNSSLTCTKPNDGTTQSITLTPTTTGGQTVKVWYRFFGFPAKAV